MPRHYAVMAGQKAPTGPRKARRNDRLRAVFAPDPTVMAGQSRPKDGVLSHAYVPAIHVLLGAHPKAWMPGTSPGMTSPLFNNAPLTQTCNFV